MQNEQGKIDFINNNGYTKGRGRQTVHTMGQGRTGWPEKGGSSRL